MAHSTPSKTSVPFNEVEGIASTNVPAYSNHNSSIFRIGRQYLHGIYTGYQWQCVEFARRWLLIRKGCVFRDIPSACNIWTDVQHIERVTDGQQFALRPIANGSRQSPKKDSLLIYKRSRRMPFGHVAIITDVIDDHVHIAEQNNLYNYWQGDYARRAPIKLENGLYYIDESDKIFGWMEIDDNDQLEPFDESNKDRILEQYIYRKPQGFFQRLFRSKTSQTTQ